MLNVVVPPQEELESMSEFLVIKSAQEQREEGVEQPVDTAYIGERDGMPVLKAVFDVHHFHTDDIELCVENDELTLEAVNTEVIETFVLVVFIVFIAFISSTSSSSPSSSSTSTLFLSLTPTITLLIILVFRSLDNKIPARKVHDTPAPVSCGVFITSLPFQLQGTDGLQYFFQKT